MSNGPYRAKILAQKFKDTNKDFLGPYYEHKFNGNEADVILYIVPSANSLYIQSMARARRLLIIVTDRHGDSNDAVMNKAVKNDLVKKVSVDDVSLNSNTGSASKKTKTE